MLPFFHIGRPSLTPARKRTMEAMRQQLRQAINREDALFWEKDNGAASGAIGKASTDKSHHPSAAPEVVIYPETTEEVMAVVKACAEHQIPVTTRGGGTGLEGGAIPYAGGAVVDLSCMTRILEHHEAESQVTVEAGVVKSVLERWCDERGLLLPLDPGSDTCIGGYASTGASGTLSVKYGTVRDIVLRMRVVLPDGRSMWTRSRAIKSSMGYDLNHLFMGAEGTLGIVTELTLRLCPKPAFTVAAVAPFASLDDAARAVIDIAKARAPHLARLELLNATIVGCVNSLFNTSHAEAPTLFLEFHALSEKSGMADAKYVEDLCRARGCASWSLATDAAEREALWNARKGAYFAAFKAMAPHEGRKVKLHVTDVCVPLGRFADVILATEADFAVSATGLVCPIVGHAADGNFHALVPYDPDDAAQSGELAALEERMVLRALEAGGTASGEHGVGVGKMRFLEPEHGVAWMDVMRAIKAAVDPLGIMNPGKLVPPREENDKEK